MTGTIALTSPSSHFATGQPQGGAQPALPSLTPLPAPAGSIPRVIPLEPPPGDGREAGPAPQPKVIRFPTDASGLVPNHPPLTTTPRSNGEVVQDLTNLIQMVKDPEAEISLVEGQTKIIQTRRDITRVVISNPLIADVELLTDQPDRLLNVSGKMFGTTSLTIWDQTNRSVSFLVRVSIDTKDLESRIRQAFPGAEIKVRQVGLQLILDGQAPDSKTMADILQLVTMTFMSSPSFRGGAGGGMGGMGGEWPAERAAGGRRRGGGRRRHGRRWRRSHGWRWDGGRRRRRRRLWHAW